jgi:predicted MFS family arabinose efflux permease
VFTLRFVPNSTEGHTHRFDTVGSVLSALAIGGLVLGIQEGPERGWSSTVAIAGLAIGAASLIGFVLVEFRAESPLFDLRTFADRSLATGSLTLLIIFGAMFGSLLVLFPFFQAVLGWSALGSAAGILPMAAMMMPMSTVAPRIAGRFGTRATMAAGAGIFTAGLVALALGASVEGGYFSVLPGLLLFGLGLGLSMTPATTVITESLPADKQGVASALNDTTRELGGAIGVALLGSVFSAGFRSSMTPALKDLPKELSEPASEGIGKAFGVAANAGDAAPRIIDAAKHALVDGWVKSMWAGAAFGLAAFLFVLVRGPKSAPAADAVELAVEPAS